MNATNTIFIYWVRITYSKLPVKFQSDPLHILWTKMEKYKNRINYASLC